MRRGSFRDADGRKIPGGEDWKQPAAALAISGFLQKAFIRNHAGLRAGTQVIDSTSASMSDAGLCTVFHVLLRSAVFRRVRLAGTVRFPANAAGETVNRSSSPSVSLLQIVGL